MRAGKMVAQKVTSKTDREDLAELMVGRKVLLQVDKEDKDKGEVLLKVNKLSVLDENNIFRLKDVSFEVHAGEVVGIAGVSGNGQSALLKVLSGISNITQGSVEILGQKMDSKNPIFPDKLRELGLSHVPEDRLRMGLISEFSASENSIIGYHNDKQINGRFIMNNAKVRNECAKLMEGFDVRPADPDLKSSNFSGGNQQKLILAREFNRNPKILLIGQPTRGVDIGAIEFIHKRIIEMRNSGKAVLLVSVELDEIMSISDRIIVLCDGHISGRVDAKSADERTLGLMMANAYDTTNNLESN
jgi:simple sugar transport system ATP-binding protein